ncbi:hypothetical protein TELCIR_06780 [Teladorsagia circumcincta]|uniref:Uncharacterized protein n=1 Tax=Teladorsagia circumcincta TaxID=45464 RepID=A0A2G9UM37_TELCI|nr:hypothetical protein TELCIR_06780 [Teladorsagia circumcincta]
MCQLQKTPEIPEVMLLFVVVRRALRYVRKRIRLFGLGIVHWIHLIAERQVALKALQDSGLYLSVHTTPSQELM